MEILHEDDGKKGEFYIEDNGKRVARIQYFASREGEINVYHTEVADSLAGQGVGKKMVTRVVEFARERGLKIHATCSYAHKVLSADASYADILIG